MFWFFYCVFFLFLSRCPSTVSGVFVNFFDTLAVVVIVKGISCRFYIAFSRVDFIGLFRFLWMNVTTSEIVLSCSSELTLCSMP